MQKTIIFIAVTLAIKSVVTNAQLYNKTSNVPVDTPIRTSLDKKYVTDVHYNPKYKEKYEIEREKIKQQHTANKKAQRQLQANQYFNH